MRTQVAPLVAADQLVDLAERPEPDARQHLQRFRVFSNNPYGIITLSQLENDFFNDEPKWPLWRAEVAPTRSIESTGTRSVTANGGRGFDVAMAEVGGLFECFERYSLSMRGHHRLIETSERALSTQSADYLGLSSFTSTPVAAVELDRQRLWVPAEHFDGSPVLVPAQFVFVPYGLVDDEPLLRDPLTTGTAAGLHYGAAILRAYLEAAERDAAMRFHYGAIGAKAISVDDVRQVGLEREVGDLARHGLEWVALQLETDLECHVIAVLVRDRSPAPMFTVGTCGRLDVASALRGALMEAVTFRRGLRARINSASTRDRWSGRSSDIACLEDRAWFWQDPSNASSIHYLDWDRPRISTEGLMTSFTAVGLAASLRQRGPVAHLDVTAPELAGAGVRVVKVVAPSLQPMHLNEQLEVRMPVSMTDGAAPRFPHPFL